MNNKQVVQSLWIGSELSNMEIMCIKSFMQNNYEYHLYIYDHIYNIPDGTIIKDANDILDISEVYSYQNSSYSAISNRFRFELLYKVGGIWVDTDVVCIKYYNFSNDEYLIISEANKKYNEEKIGCSILKFPKNNYILLEAIDLCKQAKQDIIDGKLIWGLGPRTTKFLVDKYNLHKYVKSWDFSNSCSCHHAKSLIDPTFTTKDSQKMMTNINHISDNTYFVHLWNEFWRREQLDKNAQHIGSLYNALIVKYM